ncbi:MAG: TSUP family transporter [Rhodospirillales bacterium]|nr:TSUP family transporter [Rhodospirillales bacterium]
MSSVQFLGIPDVGVWLFFGLVLASFLTTILGALAGTGGGLVLLATMALVFPPAVLVPVHTVVQLGVGTSRAIIMWRHIMRGTLLPFLIGAALGAALGAQIFISLPTGILQGAIGCFVLILAWLPKFTRVGSENRRFAVVGFVSTFLGIFVSATGTLVAPFVAGAAPDRRNHAATLGALMASVHIMKLIAFGLLGVAIAAYTPLIIGMIGSAILGSWVSSRLLDHMPEKLFRAVFQILLSGLAIRLLWVGVTEAGVFPIFTN